MRTNKFSNGPLADFQRLTGSLAKTPSMQVKGKPPGPRPAATTNKKTFKPRFVKPRDHKGTIRYLTHPWHGDLGVRQKLTPFGIDLDFGHVPAHTKRVLKHVLQDLAVGIPEITGALMKEAAALNPANVVVRTIFQRRDECCGMDLEDRLRCMVRCALAQLVGAEVKTDFEIVEFPSRQSA